MGKPEASAFKLTLFDPHDSNHLLHYAQFIADAASGFIHLLPLGLRVQEKLERLLDKHMTRIGTI